MSQFKKWEDIEKDFNFTPEEDAELELELELIKAAIKARKEANLTQRELSEMTGIKQPSIAQIESLVHSPQASTLIRLLYPMGYTLQIVPIQDRKKSNKKSKKKALAK